MISYSVQEEATFHLLAAFYRTHPKDGEGNVLTRVCLSVCPPGGTYLPGKREGGYLPSSWGSSYPGWGEGGT